MSKFDIHSKSGRIRAESDDCENITLYIWNTPGFAAHLVDHVVTVKLKDLREIVSHFDWLQSDEKPSERKEQDTHTSITLEIDPEQIAKLVAKHVARTLYESVRLKRGPKSL